MICHMSGSMLSPLLNLELVMYWLKYFYLYFINQENLFLNSLHLINLLLSFPYSKVLTFKIERGFKTKLKTTLCIQCIENYA